MSRRKRSRSRKVVAATSLGSVVVTVVCLGLLFLVQQMRNGSGGGQPVVETPVSGGWYSVYFSRPSGSGDTSTYHGGLDETIAASVADAQHTIDVAIYEFDRQPLADALAAAHARGVAVRLVTDSDTVGEDGIGIVEEAGIPVVEDDRSAIMHDKFMVIDQSVVWTGSMNYTMTDVYRNDNNLLRLTSSRLAANYATEFDEMFTGHQFGTTSPENTPNPKVSIDGSLVETYFAAEGDTASHVIEAIRGAQDSIEFMAFTFTHDEIGQAVIERAQAGVQVRGVFEQQQAEGCCPEVLRAMQEAGLNVRLDGNPYKLHHKVIVIDRQIVITGSYNFTAAAENSNDENLLILHNADIAGAYGQEFERVWGLAGSG
jgi:phosphatidylserine/phosphatidylglycerophosphate/cardiolipin synthase-like enzyme